MSPPEPLGYLRSFYLAQALRLKRSLIQQTPLLDWVGEQGTVVDVGCGYGVLSRLIAAARPGVSVLGIEPDATRVRYGQLWASELANLRIVQGDARTYAYPACDLVLFFDVLHHMVPSDQDQVIAMVARALNPGGRLVVFEVDPDARPRFRCWMSHLWDTLLYPRMVRCQFRSKQEIESVAKKAGLSLEQSMGLHLWLGAPVMYMFRSSSTISPGIAES